MSTEAPFTTDCDAPDAALHEINDLRATLKGANEAKRELRAQIEELRVESHAACQALADALGYYPRAPGADGNPDPKADYVTPPLAEVVTSAVSQLHAYNARALDMRARINELEALADTATAAEEDAMQKLTPDRVALALMKSCAGESLTGYIIRETARELVEALAND